MAFGSIVLLLLFYYIRPQDWVPGMSGFNVIKVVVAGGILGLMKRDRSDPRWNFMSSPQEWVVLIFFLYVVFTSPDPGGAATDLGVLVVYMFIGLHTLTTEDLLERYLKWWLGALIGVLIMIVLTRVGMDITGANSLIEAFRGRFCLNTYTLNNPNALGHTIVAVLPLGYYLWFWDNTVLSRVRAMILIAVAVWAVIPTGSKGSFISGAVSFLVSILFGRKVFVQVIVAVLALAMGGTILATLPRMQGMKSLGSDQGVQGRMMAWSMARAVTITNLTGMGYKHFEAWIRWEGTMDNKSTHSSFVKVGGDLGVIGLTIYVGMMTVCGRSLVQYRGLTSTMECCRRALFALLLGMCISGWMINKEYYTEVFCLIGAVGAYHQISVKQRRDLAFAQLESPEADANKSGGGERKIAGLLPAFDRAAPNSLKSKGVNEDMVDPARMILASRLKVPGLWTHLGVLDLALAIAGGQLTLQLWDYIMANIK